MTPKVSILCQQVNSAFHPSGVGKSSTGLLCLCWMAGKTVDPI